MLCVVVSVAFAVVIVVSFGVVPAPARAAECAARWRLMRQARTSLTLGAVRSSRAVAVRVSASAGS